MKRESTNSIVLLWIGAAAARLALIKYEVKKAVGSIHAENLDDAFLATAKGMKYLSSDCDWRSGSV